MNLHELQTPHPLRDADFAAIRARVKAEIAREASPWTAIFARLAFAAALVVVFVPLTRERVPNVPVPRSGPPASASPGAPASSPAVVAARPAAETPALRKTRRVERVAQRIEIITADPTIRIIWITPKENS